MLPSESIKQASFRLGFSNCGVARCEPLDYLRPFYREYIRRGNNASLKYLETNMEKRLNPTLVMEETRSVIALLFHYYPGETPKQENNFIVARYALGRDYHPLLKSRMNELITFMQTEYGPHKARAFVDSGTVLEKVWAMKCGLGWQGKNSLLINHASGSFFFIGIILSELDLEPDVQETDHCGSCMKCIDACPTKALHTPYQVDIAKCIAYHTIETRDEIPTEIRLNLNRRIFGCDICQEVCPFNRNHASHNEPSLNPQEGLLQMKTTDWADLTEEQFNFLFKKSSVRRTGFSKLSGNIRAASSEA